MGRILAGFDLARVFAVMQRQRLRVLRCHMGQRFGNSNGRERLGEDAYPNQATDAEKEIATT